MRPFYPIFGNPHILTIAGNYWRRNLDTLRFPVSARYFQTEPDVQVLVHSQEPEGRSRGDLILVHGLEGSSSAGYAQSAAQAALLAGFSVHRFNMRSCGGTEHLSPTNYHAGQTSDLNFVVRSIGREYGGPVILIGFSLGGNASLKLAGELKDEPGVLAGVCAVSTPLNLEACADQLNRRSNFVYQRRFLLALKERVRRRHQDQPDRYDIAKLPSVRSIWDFDEAYTSKLFGFGTARNYFRTQSSAQFLADIRIPCLLIHAKDDPMIPYSVYQEALPLIENNRNIRFLPFDTGGHVGFISSTNPRFWIDPIIARWAIDIGNKSSNSSVLL